MEIIHVMPFKRFPFDRTCIFSPHSPALYLSQKKYGDREKVAKSYNLLYNISLTNIDAYIKIWICTVKLKTAGAFLPVPFRPSFVEKLYNFTRLYSLSKLS